MARKAKKQTLAASPVPPPLFEDAANANAKTDPSAVGVEALSPAPAPTTTATTEATVLAPAAEEVKEVKETKAVPTPKGQSVKKKAHSPSRVPVPVKARPVAAPKPKTPSRPPTSTATASTHASNNSTTMVNPKAPPAATYKKPVAVSRTDSGFSKVATTKPSSADLKDNTKPASTTTTATTIEKKTVEKKPSSASLTSKKSVLDLAKKPALQAETKAREHVAPVKKSSSADLKKTAKVAEPIKKSVFVEPKKPAVATESKKHASPPAPVVPKFAAAPAPKTTTKPPAIKPSGIQHHLPANFKNENEKLKKENLELKKKLEDLASELATLKMHDVVPTCEELFQTQSYMPVPDETTPLLQAQEGGDEDDEQSALDADDVNDIKEDVHPEEDITATTLLPPAPFVEDTYDADFEVDEDAKFVPVVGGGSNHKTDDMVVDVDDIVTIEDGREEEDEKKMEKEHEAGVKTDDEKEEGDHIKVAPSTERKRATGGRRGGKKAVAAIDHEDPSLDIHLDDTEIQKQSAAEAAEAEAVGRALRSRRAKV
ncbi:UNVERIFIED_CONTAM: hypothetical protein HDU68_006045 [Siphonaria sp. JEL0065]|nr:hypothetical protein HDU68_006045 [Siphonaria sp. JEL0065]